MCNLIVCDDDHGFAELLAEKIKGLDIDAVQHVYYYANPDGMLFDLQENMVNAGVFLLDIKLGDKNGICVAEQILQGWPDSQIIFISAYDDYYEAVYDVEHVYFIKKPIDDGVLKKAVLRAIDKLTVKNAEFFYVENKNGKYIISYDDIYFFEKQQRKVQVCGRGGEVMCSFYGKFAEMEGQLPYYFLQCHSSIFVNLKKVQAIEHDCFALRGGTSVPISRSHHKTCRIEFARYVNNILP